MYKIARLSVISWNDYASRMKFGQCLACGQTKCNCWIRNVSVTADNEVHVLYEVSDGQ